MSANRSANATAPGHGATVATASDVTVFPTSRALYIGTAGNLTVRMADGQVVSFLNVANGTLLPIQVEQVRNATTASDILIIY